jgi:hypothetical protein
VDVVVLQPAVTMRRPRDSMPAPLPPDSAMPAAIEAYRCTGAPPALADLREKIRRYF